MTPGQLGSDVLEKTRPEQSPPAPTSTAPVPVAPPSPSTWRKFRRKLKQEGPWFTLQVAVRNVIPRALLSFEADVMLGQDLEDHGDTEGAGDAERPRWATDADVDLLTVSGTSAGIVRYRFAQGERAAIMVKDGRLMGHVWYATRSLRLWPWLAYKLRPNEVCGWDLWVSPEYRGFGASYRLLNFGETQLARDGKTRLYGWVEVLNKTATRMHAIQGWTNLRKLIYVRVLGVAFVFAGGWFKIGVWTKERPLVVPFDIFEN